MAVVAISEAGTERSEKLYPHVWFSLTFTPPLFYAIVGSRKERRYQHCNNAEKFDL